MRDYLTFVLAAPLASFGEVASGERRGSAPTPTRSAVFGLIAAALGLERDARAELDALTAGYGAARALLPVASPLLDYHTVHDPHGPDLSRFARRHGRPPATRAEALAAGERKTLLTRRDYWCDVVVLVALWVRADAPYALTHLAQALKHPRFVLYLGRKSCPLMLPTDPQLVFARDAVEAIAMSAPKADIDRLTAGSKESRTWRQAPVEVSLDADDPAAEGAQARVSERRDLSRHHPAWLFSVRRDVTVAAQPPVASRAP